ncbi:MAG: phage portal protein [Brevundimonas sp.]|uniref:phage portal protein n=1 Tax=Brevundimonas sp. TaxID=1871086 RepID=UPI0040346A96
MADTSSPAVSASEPASDTLTDPTGFSVTALLGRGGRSAPVSEKSVLTLPAAWRALEILTGVFALTPMIYYRRLDDDGKERATGSPLYKMFRDRPNGIQSDFQFKEVLLGDLLLAGKFLAFQHRDALYQTTALSRLDPYGAAVSQQWDRTDGHELFFDVNLPDGSRERLTRADVWYVPGFSRDGIGGLDRVQFMQDAINAGVATAGFAARFWENNAQPSTVLAAKGKVAPEDKAKIRADWKARFSGTKSAGDVAVVDQEMDVKFLQHDNKASQHIESRTFNVLDMARMWGVPPHLLFELSRATFSNIDHQSLEFILYSMSPHYSRVAAAATHAFAEPGHYFEFLPEALLKGDIKSRFEAYGIGIDKGILSPNEARVMENRNKRDGGDEYRMGSGSTLESAEPSQPKPTPAPAPEDED